MSDKEKGVGIDRELTGEIRLGKPISSKKYWELVFDTKQEAQRAVDCLQAMSGITDPQKFMEAVRELQNTAELCIKLGWGKNLPGYNQSLVAAISNLRAASEWNNF